MKSGKVYLVGAGPGDPGLITRKGLECLTKADVVIYDHLLDKSLLDNISHTARKIYVGKKAGKHAKEQDEINQLLVDEARKGSVVVRLKGGDLFVLGRGGEEIEMLRKKGIRFEIVPGVTSAIGVPAYAGIPLTHRAFSSSFAVVTGHEDPDRDTSRINWEKLSTGVDTLVFLMGLKHLPDIVSKLIQNGRSSDTPVAVINNGTCPEQKTIVGTLENIVAETNKQAIHPPVVIVIGKVVNLRDICRWYDNQPLFGKNVLVTRARHQASSLSALLYEKGARPIELPAIEIRPAVNKKMLDDAIKNIEKYQWILFTSTNGVEAFFKRMAELNLDARSLSKIKVGAIGPPTARSLKKLGIIADYVPDRFTSEGLIEGLKTKNIKGKRLLLPRADIADEELTVGLAELGAEVHEIIAYVTEPDKESILKARGLISTGKIDIIAFTSSSTVSNLIAVFGNESSLINKAEIACIGPKTAATAKEAGLKVDIIAEESTITGLVDAIEQYFREER